MFIETGVNVFFLKEILRMLENEHETKIVKLQFEQSKQIVQSFRAKHHDIINHYQVVMGLIQMGRNNEAIDYMKTLSKELVQVEKLAALKRPEVAAIISTKVTELNYVQLTFEINTDLEYLAVCPDKIVSILGNLLDNALYEAALTKEKWISLKIYEKNDWYSFEIINPGHIDEGIRDKIFLQGFTTKGNKGSGMGLFIASNVIKSQGGTIELIFPGENLVMLKVGLPKSINS
ncbi:MAG: ATP-binding protein, partial [Dehalobacterium sp.]